MSLQSLYRLTKHFPSYRKSSEGIYFILRLFWKRNDHSEYFRIITLTKKIHLLRRVLNRDDDLVLRGQTLLLLKFDRYPWIKEL